MIITLGNKVIKGVLGEDHLFFFVLLGVGVGVADFPAVFFHICHGTQQAVVTAYRAYQNV